jgi:hypothetical protein
MVVGNKSSGVTWQPSLANSSSSVAFPSRDARVAIFDTDFILNHVRDRIRNGGVYTDSPLMGGRAFASSHVLEELYEPDAFGHRHKWDKLAEQSESGGWPTPSDVFQTTFEDEYLEHITFVDVNGMFENHSLVERVRVRDASDAPTAQLAVLLARAEPVIYSHDAHLWKSGAAPSPEILPVVVTSGRQVDLVNHSVEGVSFVGAAIVMAGDRAARGAATLLRVPKWTARFATVVGIGWFFAGHDRRQKLVKVLTPFGQLLAEQLENARGAVKVLASAVVRVDFMDGIEHRIAQVLALRSGGGGLLAPEIREQLMLHDSSATIPSIPEIRRILTSAPCFVEERRYRYQLGRRFDSPNHGMD